MGGTQRTSGSQPFTLTSVLVVMIIVGGITGVIGIRSPPRDIPPPEPEWERFSNYTLSFVHLKGTNFTSDGIREENATKYSGCLFTNMSVVEPPPEEITVIWDLAPLDTDVGDAFEGAFDRLSLDKNSLSLGLYNISTRGIHELHYQYYNTSDQGGRELSGVAGVWYCNETRRLITVNFLNCTGSASQEVMKERYKDLMDYFGCHSSRRSSQGPRLGLFNVYDLNSISMMIFLCIGFTFTFMMDGFLNLAHTSYAGIGGMVSSYLIRFWGFDSYDTWPIAALVGGLIGMFLYVAVVRPIGTKARSWNRDIALTFAFWVVTILLGSTSVLYSFWDRVEMRSFESEHALGSSHFSWYGIPSNVFLGTVYCIIFLVGLHLLFKRTRIGYSLRATAEDEELAETLGIDTGRAHLISWFISGALSAIAGAIFRVGGGGGASDSLIVSVMTGSILGGLTDVYGAIFGGIFVAIGQKTINHVLLQIFGIAINYWLRLTPILFLWAVLMIAPNGITGLRLSSSMVVRRLSVLLTKIKSGVNGLFKSA
jgi:branched-chain amino acid transport system permease protein